MIDLEKYWIAKEEILKTEHLDLDYWDDMNKNGWKLSTSKGHLESFHVYMWESENYKDHSLLEVFEEDISDCFLVPDRLQFFIHLWMKTNIPSNRAHTDCIDAKWQWQIDRGWFKDPHLCKVTCRKCEKFWGDKIRSECERRV